MNIERPAGRDREELVLGLDLGTSAVKAILLSVNGAVVAEATQPLGLIIPRPGWSEQHPDDWYSAACRCIRGLDMVGSGLLDRIAGVGVSGQMHGAVFLDPLGRVLRPAILWNDQRSAAECREITERVGFARLVRLTGNRALAGFTAPKILWVRHHEPEVFEATAGVLLPKDYLNYLLTSSRSTEPSDASGTLLFDVSVRQWSAELLELLELPSDLLPPVKTSSAVMGRVTGDAARATGLREGTPVVGGGADNACSALGIGITRPGETMVSIGTSGTVLAPSDRPRVEPEARLHTFCHVLEGVWYSMGVVLSAGASFRWFRDVVASGMSLDEAKAPTYDELTRLAESVTPGSDGLLFLPYLSGERTPHGDPDARGVFFGLSLLHTKAHLTRAVLEGITFALRDSLFLLTEAGLEPSEVRATGGGAASRVWLQILADVSGLQVSTPMRSLGPAFGAAILAGVGVGLFSSPADAVSRFVAAYPVAAPDPTAAAAYEQAYRRYRRLYPALGPLFR